jgi:signal transduction histidine kinase
MEADPRGQTKGRVAAPDARGFFISTVAPGRGQTRLAAAFVLFLVAFGVVVALYRRVQLPPIYAIIPAFAMALVITDLLTAFLLYSQFWLLRRRALLVIASGYLFTAFILVPWAMTFPGSFSPGGLLGAGAQTTAWLYVLWHAGFPMFVIGYALLKDHDPAKSLSHGSPVTAIFASVVLVAAFVCALTFLTTVGQDLLPSIAVDALHQRQPWNILVSCSGALAAMAGALIWLRHGSVLDLWLMVVMFSFSLESFLVSIATNSRFDLTWYATRFLGLLSASFVLSTLLYETTTLYAQLLRALLARRRERDARLMTGDAVSASLAHEMRQPLTGIVANAEAGLRFLKRESPVLEEVEAALQCILDDGYRAGAVIESVRASFRSGAGVRTSLDIKKLVRNSLALSRAELQAHKISVNVVTAERVPRVIGDEIQLQQVLINLIINATDAMATVMDRERVLQISCGQQQPGRVSISVEDSGPGVEPEDIERVFDPLFTTKPSGTGLGLAISRSIVEAHQGSLVAVPNRCRSGGALFQLLLPAEAS